MSVIIQGPVSGLSDADQAYIDLAQTTVPDASKLVDSDNLSTAAYAATGDFDAAWTLYGPGWSQHCVLR